MPRRALVLACCLVAAVAVGCGGDDSTGDADAVEVRVEASNTSEGRFPDEELVRAQEEAAAEEAAAAEVAASEALAAEEAAAVAEPAPEPVEEPVEEPAEPEPAPEPPQAAESTESASGIPAGAIEPGRYTTATFEPGFTLDVESGWLSFQAELEDFVALSPADDLDLTVSFLSPNLAQALIDEEGEYTDTNPTDEQLLDPVAFDYFDWVHQHQRYEAGEISSELLAGRAVSSFDATLTSGYAWQECLADCTLLVATSDGELLAQEVGYRERLYATKVDDLTLIVSVAAPEAKFEAFIPRAVELLRTLELVADAEPATEDDTPVEEAPAVDPAVEPPPPAEPPTPVEPPAPAPPQPGPAEPVAPPEEEEELEEPERLPPAPLES